MIIIIIIIKRDQEFSMMCNLGFVISLVNDHLLQQH